MYCLLPRWIDTWSKPWLRSKLWYAAATELIIKIESLWKISKGFFVEKRLK